MEQGDLAKVLQDFLTTVDGELSLLKGDYFLVLSVIDKHWCYGQSYNSLGKFPKNYLHKIDIPEFKEGENLYVSIAKFTGEQDGDLSFGKGEIVIGSRELEPGWIYGRTDLGEGIFPATHAWKLDSALVKKTTKSKSINRQATVTADLEAQLDEELDLVKGTTVTVTEILDDGWCRGITDDGRTGTFPQGFIEYSSKTDELESHNQPGTSSSSSSLKNATKKLKKDTNMSFEAGAMSLLSQEDEPAPSYDDLFPQFAAEKVARAVESSPYKSEQDLTLNPLGVEPYAITLYPFNAQFPNELSFGVGEVVRLIKHKDSEWLEGSIDNVKGIFPVSYVNIIVDCVKERKEDEESFDSVGNKIDEVDDEDLTIDAAALVPGIVLRVEYKFEAQMSGDLSVNEGDFVTVVETANADWVCVKNENGDVGLCPRGYLTADFIDREEDSAEDGERGRETLGNIHEPIIEEEEFVLLMDSGEGEEFRRNKGEGENKEAEDYSKRLSLPHRPAPPAPAPGRIPLQKQTQEDQEVGESIGGGIEELSETESRANAKKKRADQRQNVISELVITEKEYVRDLKLTYETFNLYDPGKLESRGINVTVLFGNFLEVIKVAEELLDKMQRAMKGCDEEFQTVGPCFTKMSDKLQVTYVKYCSNHEAALVLLKKYEDNPEATILFQKGIETLRHQIACFDMSSILIKPVQRILKYPLMLYELVKCTEDDHPDKPELDEAWRAMTNVASYINEHKRRKDIVNKYFEGDSTLMGRMAKLNIHSVAKKSTRLSAKLSASLGLTNVALDVNFDDYERQFKSLEKSTWQFARDVEQCVVYLGEEAFGAQLTSELIHQYYQGTVNEEVRRLNETRAIIWSNYFQELKSCIERRVATPLNSLINLLQGPALLIDKRHDKLLDYDVALSKSEKNRDNKMIQDELFRAKTNYEALNQQLLDELPTLIEASLKILVNCFGAFANSRKLLCGRVTKRYLSLSETATQITSQDILESFLVGHNLLWNQITRFSFAGTNPRIEESHSEWCEQSERQRITLRNKYSVDKLYKVTEDVISTSSLDIGARRGTLVAVIKKQDPMGDSNRWFVDNGSIQGFLPKQNLERLAMWKRESFGSIGSSGGTTNGTSASTSPASTPDLICMDSPEKDLKSNFSTLKENQVYRNLEEALMEVDKGNEKHEVTKSYSSSTVTDSGQINDQRYQNLKDVFYYALYDFDGGITGTLPMKKGQAVKLLRTCDEMKNDAWWLVQDRTGASGYVPSNYLGTPDALNA